ncbi:C-5 cytosine-specific DNA methylase [Vibrio phage 1.021.C._10N.222.51.F9]|nr:C-5 cytosine-specific DNA methylase [Vibrio phage 1.021.A._10N.222.51.F9]AUR82139.1 C-5 cytosine-specific DNA methylase [Vibrio phage 1.021.B._10N.222.51.F9]AUR82189.1 C-5 cytosine-specific DNA methylase [Vibrio phage 1.021.C._10N.222.51.F9]
MFLNKGINVLSLFDGKSSGRTACDLAGIGVDKYYSAEVDKYAIQVSNAIHPDVIRLGDVTKWREWDVDWASIDLLLAGSPCQGFSFAGKQLAFDDPRSALFFVFVDILNHIKSVNPSVEFMLENVKMKEEFLTVITDMVEADPVLINSALVSAQNRKRFYWCNWELPQPEDRLITWGDVREHNVDLSRYYYTEKGIEWLINHSRRKNKTLTVHGDHEKMQMIEASHHKNYSSQRFFGICDIPASEEAVASLRGRRIDPVTMKRVDDRNDIKPVQHVEFRYDGKTNCLTTVGKDNVVVPFTLPNRIPQDSFFFRYITPRECFRLQTVPEHLIDKILSCGVSNTQLYKIAGNGWTDEVIAHNLRHSRLCYANS